MNWPYKIWCGFIAAIVIVPRHQSSTCAAPRALQSDDSECQRHVDCGFLGNDPGSPQFCSDELFCEPCRGGWWDTNGGACHGEMSVDGNCASCGVGTPPAAFGDPMEAAEATMATEPEDAECFDHANCNVPGFAQFCSDEFFCEPCREGWWDTNGGECHGGMSVDGSCAPCGGRPGAEGRPPTPRPSAPVPSCEDGNESCEAWATAGECEVNPTFMLTNCARSCNTCESANPLEPTPESADNDAEVETEAPTQGSTAAPTAAPTMRRGQTESTPPREIAIDWIFPGPQGLPSISANIGDTLVFRWEGFHNVYIAPSNSCDSLASGSNLGASSPVRYTVQAGDEGGIVFACEVPGHCQAGMLLSVDVGQTGAPLTESINATTCEDREGDCGGWASLGECERNPSYMLSSCTRACGAC